MATTKIISGMSLIDDERWSQKSRGYDVLHDSNYVDGELIDAVDAHLAAAEGFMSEAKDIWPWDQSTFHVNTPISSLAKAGALIAAEIDRRLGEGEAP